MGVWQNGSTLSMEVNFHFETVWLLACFLRYTHSLLEFRVVNVSQRVALESTSRRVAGTPSCTELVKVIP